jgi:hypothetical protein
VITPADEPLPPPPGGPARADPSGLSVRSGLSLRQAEELLDWLENHDCRDWVFEWDSERGATVRWRF